MHVLFNVICKCGPLSQRMSTNYATPEPAANVIPLSSPLPLPTTPSPQLESVVNMPGYNIKKVLSICVMSGHTHYSTNFRPIVTRRRMVQHEVPK